MALIDNLLAAGLPVISASETGEVVSGAMTPAQKAQFDDILLQYFNPTKWAKVIADRQSLQVMKTEYAAAVARLKQIETTAPTNNAQIIAAVQDMAKYQRELLEFLRDKIIG